ncbi:MAG TPA: hypothetical protein VFX96_17810, partial [Pyrinomonadaceae bacterium]|nr:hypothetical protein [Pyrinomonadaceae bacterium]
MLKKYSRPRHASLILSLLLAILPASAAQQKPQTRPAQTRPATTRPAPGPSPATTTTQATSAAAPQAAPNEAAEADITFDTLVPADSYGVYFEVRRVGQLARSKEFTDFIDTLIPQAGPPKELGDTLEFFKTHAESLENAQMHVVTMPTREGLPQAIGALQLPSVEDAKRVEPTLRGLVKKFEELSAAPEKDAAATQTTATTTRNTQPRNTQRRGRAAEPVRADAKPPVPAFYFKRVGRLLLTSDVPMNAPALKVANRQPLFANPRLQAARARLATEQVFIFFDVGLLEKGAAVQREAYMERARKEEEERAARAVETTTAETNVPPSDEASSVASEINAELSTTVEPNVLPPAPVPPPTEEQLTASADAQVVRGEVPQGEVRGPSEEEMAVRRADMLASRLFGMAFGGMPVWPEAVGAGASFSGEEITVRALLISGAGAELRIVPFLPLLISGPEVVPAASSVAPEDAEVFVNLSLDWQRLYAQMLNAASNQPIQYDSEGQPATEQGEEQTPEKSIEAVEKLFGFKV